MITPGNVFLTSIIAILVLGSKKVRHLGSDLGAAIKNFREALSGETKTSEEKENNESSKS